MKKGISPLIATILLLGFTIVLASLIFRFSGELFESQTLETGSTSEISLNCASKVDIKVEESCISPTGVKMLINNRGIDLNGFVFQVFDDAGAVTSNSTGLASLNSRNFVATRNSFDVSKINIIPQIMTESKLGNCGEEVFRPQELEFCKPVKDVNTLLLLHFDDSLEGEDGEVPSPGTTATLIEHEYGKGVLIDQTSDIMTFSASDFDMNQGTVEFWIRPMFNADDGSLNNFVTSTFTASGSSGPCNAGNPIKTRIRKWDGGAIPQDAFWESKSHACGDAEGDKIVGITVGNPNSIYYKSAGQWYHFAVSWDSDSNGYYVANLSVDGKLVASASGEEPDGFERFHTIVNQGVDIGGEVASFPSNAVLDELRISNVIRTDFK